MLYRSIFLLTAFVSLLASAQVKDEKGNPVSEVVFNSKRGFEALPLLSGRDLIFTRSISINGEVVGAFAIDTGLNISMIDKNYAKELGLSQNIPGLTTSVNDIRRFNFFRVDSISMGRLQIKNHILYSGNVSQRYFKMKERVVGVIGCDLLSKMPFTIDYQNFILTFFSRQKFKPAGKAIDIEISHPIKNLGIYSEANPNAGIPLLKAKLNKSMEEDFLLDTGEEDGVVLRANTALKLKHLKGNYKIPRIFLKTGGSKNQYTAKINHLEFGGIQESNPPRNYILFPEQGMVTLNNQIGNSILKKLKISFDFENSKAYAERYEGEQNYREELDFAEHSPIARAVRQGNLEKAKEILKDKSKRVFLGKRNETLLMLAVESMNNEMVDLLLSMGNHDLNMINSAGTSPVMRAAASNQVMVLNALIEAGALINRADKDGMTPLHYAVLGDGLAATAMLIKNKAKINAKMKNGMRPVSLAAAQGNLKVFSSLAESGADLSFVDKEGRSLLHIAAFGNNADLINEIIKHKHAPDVDSVSSSGMTPLMLAVKFLKFEAARALLKNGASVRSMNSKNFKSALDYALATKNKLMVELIEKAWEDGQSKK